MNDVDRLSAALTDRYRIERELGAGGMATVYLADDLRHKRKVAVKVLKPELAAVLGGDRFVQEITTTASLQHPHILPLFDSGEVDGLLYYVMPYIEGETIREKLNRETQFGVDDAVRIAREVADALDYAHRRGVIHRDIKPENILLHDGRAMVMDFGIALAVSAAAGGRMTETGLSLGTPHYMSPEQATAEREITPRSDVYSLASVLYEMLTGDPPFTASSAQAVIMKIITEPPPPVTVRRKSVPANVAAAVAKALEKLPADRFASANAFAEALANSTFVLAGAAAASGTAGPWKRVALAAAVVAVASLGLTLAAASRRGAGAATSPVIRFALSNDPALRVVSTMTAPFGISADGQTIVFAAIGPSGRQALWVRTLGDPVPRVLDGTEGGMHPSISPNGEWVAFIAGSRQLKKVRLSGSAVYPLADLPGVTRSLSWESNDAIFCEVIAPTRPLYRVPATGGTPQVAIPLDTAAGELGQGRNLVLASEGMLLYVSNRSSAAAPSQSGEGRDAQLVMYSMRDGRRVSLGLGAFAPLAVVDGILVYVQGSTLGAVPLDVAKMRVTGAPVTLSQHVTSSESGSAIAVAPTGTIVYQQAGAGPLLHLVLVSETGTVKTIRGDPNHYAEPRFSKDGRRIAVAISAGDIGSAAETSDIWVIDVATGEPTRVTRSGDARFPVWTRDDRWLLYTARFRERQRREIWTIPLDASAAAARLVDVGGIAQQADPTPDGKAIIASRIVGDRYELVRVGLGDHGGIDTLVSPLRPGEVRARYPRVSPNGRLLAYSERNGTSVHVRSLDAPGEIQISTNGGCCPVWGPDSRRVYFRNADSLVVVDLQTEPSLAVARRSMRAGLPSTQVGFGPDFDLSHDGTTFVTVVPIETASAVFVAVNWLEELRRERQAGVRK